jgi:hypothetical protein
MPEDFAERALAGASMAQLRKHYTAGTYVIERWVKQIGGKPRAGRVLPERRAPEGFVHWAAIEGADALAKRFRAGTKMIARWRREVSGDGPLVKPRRELKPPPEGFADTAANMTTAELCAEYGVCKVTALKWCARVGIAPRRPVRKPMPNLGAMGRPKAAPFATHRDFSSAGQAADFLRRFGPVVRTDAEGRYKPDGDHWRRGSSILTADEVIARAVRNGWNPDAWKDLAA